MRAYLVVLPLALRLRPRLVQDALCLFPGLEIFVGEDVTVGRLLLGHGVRHHCGQVALILDDLLDAMGKALVGGRNEINGIVEIVV